MIDPPIHTEYFLSGMSTTRTLILGGVRSSISFCSLSIKPVNRGGEKIMNRYFCSLPIKPVDSNENISQNN